MMDIYDIEDMKERGDFRNRVWLSKAYSDSLVALERKRYKEFVLKCIDECIQRKSGLALRTIDVYKFKKKLEEQQ